MRMTFVAALRDRSELSTFGNEVAVEPDFDFRSDEYCSLHSRSNATAFQAALWLDILYREVAPAFEAEPVIVTVRAAHNGELLLVLPLVRRRHHQVTFIEFADFGVCDYLRPIYDPADQPLLTGDVTLPGRIAALLSCDIVLLTKVHDYDALLDSLFPQAQVRQMRLSAHPVRLSKDWDQWRSSALPAGFRRDLEIKRRRVAKRGDPVLTLVEDRREIVRVFEALREFRAQRFGERKVNDILENDALFSFYRTIAIRGVNSGLTRTYCLYLSGVPCGVAFGLLHRKAFHLLLLGFDVVRYRRLSLGLLTIEDTLRATVEAGHSIYDFTIGDYPWKLQFGAASLPMHEWVHARSIRGQLSLFGTDVIRNVKRSLKTLVKKQA